MRHDRGDMPSVDPSWLRRRWRKARQVDQFNGGAAAIQYAHEVCQGMTAVVAAHGREGLAPVVELGVKRGEMRRKRERPQMSEARKPRQEIAPAVGEAHERALYLVEVSLRVMS